MVILFHCILPSYFTVQSNTTQLSFEVLKKPNYFKLPFQIPIQTTSRSFMVPLNLEKSISEKIYFIQLHEKVI